MTEQAFNLNEILKKAFPGIQAKEIQHIVNSGEVHTYPPEAVLCREDQLEMLFYILLEGEVCVTKKINAGETRVLHHLQAGDFFGEMAIIQNSSRSATVTTTQTCTVLEIGKEAFNALMTGCASIPVAMVREVTRRLRENDQMAVDDLRIKAREIANAYQSLAEQDYARREFLSTIVHELRTPLMASTGFLQVIRLGILQGEALNTALDTVARNLQDIMSLVNDILFLQEMDLILPEFQPVDLGTVVMNAIDKQRNQAENSKINLTLHISPGLPTVIADAKSLERAINAILDNAIKFSPNGGNVRIEVDHNRQNIWVSFEDEGVGISSSAIPHIFDRFYHTDEIDGHTFRGAGLGLSIARQVIEQHHGEIQVESEVNKGSKFSVLLPLDK